MPDYQGNSKKNREPDNTPPKTVERVVITDVIVQKKSIGRKFRDLFIKANFRTVARDVASDVLLPAARNMALDALNKGGERVLYGESAVRRRNLGSGGRPIYNYNNPISRGGYRDPNMPSRYAPAISPEPRSARLSRDNFYITTRDEAEMVLERMNDIIETYEVASVADLNDLVGLPTTPIDNKWGWIDLRNVPIQQDRAGYLIDFPPAEPIP